ncbi:MAG TPA: exodeoxyribonuclease VII large subunit [Pyrinomonadaceae bacterium]|nr:exodeoxyribonuclease VII large subunit [Acidobacteriota bacterium]HQZ96726.1 exodeoxyribonuclease VII large subunit [Pyrinomonadaceae bacterium]
MNDALFQFLMDDAQPEPWSVTELNAEVRGALERQFANVWVEGEVVNFIHAASGHWYFNLNDGTSQVKCVCWKGTNFRIRFKPQNGIVVRVRGRMAVYEARGELQLSVDSLEPAGEGALAAAYEQIRAKLEREGLFAKEIKREIPFFPRRVAVVTSRTGAAYHDILTVLTRRARSVSILLAPALVQGEGAADSIRRAVAAVNEYDRGLDEKEKIDVIIVGRGGGSAEDLWAFNDEALARALRASEIPVISAVGHEIDWTISDLVSDLRAATPSAAAEIVAGREEDILFDLQSVEATLASMMDYKLLMAKSSLNESAQGLQFGFSNSIQRVRSRFTDIASRLTPATLRAKTAMHVNELARLEQRKSTAIEGILASKNEEMRVNIAKLDALSPLAVLTRGYSITQGGDGKVLRDAAEVKPGDKLKIRLERGKLNAEVLSVE